MVNLTRTLMKYMPFWLPRGANEVNPSHTSNKAYMRKHNQKMLTRWYPYRARNCIKLSIRKYEWNMLTSQKHRAEKLFKFKDLFSQRIWAACDEHRFHYKYLMGVLPQMGIELDRKSLSNLAIWEPRTFASLLQLCQAKIAEEPVGEESAQYEVPAGVITRKMLTHPETLK